MNNKFCISFLLLLTLLYSCTKEDSPDPLPPEVPNPEDQIYVLPVVVHVLHQGEEVGEGPNLAEERIRRQVEILNEDFRRKPGTRGFNDHPDGADARIEFVLAEYAPDGSPIKGINRVNISEMEVPSLGHNQNHYAQYAYWPTDQYINIWTTPLPESSTCLVLGSATGPDTDLPGSSSLMLPGPGDAEGILINWMHFGVSNIDCHARYGRTLTHEMGHYLGLLHPWSGNDCEHNDYCEDTPAVDRPVFGNTPFTGCAGEPVMIENFMNYSEDEVMRIFTKDQVYRMRYVLLQHPGRRALWENDR